MNFKDEQEFEFYYPHFWLAAAQTESAPICLEAGSYPGPWSLVQVQHFFGRSGQEPERHVANSFSLNIMRLIVQNLGACASYVPSPYQLSKTQQALAK